MDNSELVRHGAHVMTVCNACRYCEHYCPVFTAIETRRSFERADLSYLANLCHNCGECLYACQYAPPHAFGIDVPRTLARMRTQSYQYYCWPGVLAGAFARSSAATAIALAAVITAALALGTLAARGWTLPPPAGPGDFYAIVPHDVMVVVSGSAFGFALLALAIGVRRFWADVEPFAAPSRAGDLLSALRDSLTLRHLHGSGTNCTTAEDHRRPWRRWLHHATFYGFLLCTASTTVAAFYHSVLAQPAPYPYFSLPVVLGAVGGIGLLVGSAGLWIDRGARDLELRDPAGDGADRAFLVLLFLSALSGLLLLGLRESSVMGALLIIHLGAVLALFITLPYGKFVHALYRTAALVKHAKETREAEEDVRS